MATIADAPELPPWLARELPFGRRWLQSATGGVHFIDEGSGRAVLLLHGNPTWSFLWRKVIKLIAPRGIRCIVPDLVGFGLSSKPRTAAAHQLQMHIDAISELANVLDLRELTVVGQDWGGPIGVGVARQTPGRVNGLVLSNTSVLRPRLPIHTTAFHRFARVPLVSELAFRGLAFPLPLLFLAQGRRSSIGVLETRAYLYPFRRRVDRIGPLALARMVPHRADHPSMPVLEANDAWCRQFRGPVALIWGMRDPILGRALNRHRAAFPEARVVETEAGHFLQEEVPDVLADEICRGASDLGST